MMYLEELEKKVLQLIDKNQDMKKQLEALTKENEFLKEQGRQFQATLLKETTAAQALMKEKAALASGIEELLSSIDALEKAH